MRTIAIINQKGGVGKTTTTANLAHALSLDGYKVAMVDLDPQGHLGATFGIDPRQSVGMDQVLLNDMNIDSYIIDVKENLQLVPAGTELGQLELLAEGGASRGGRLKHALIDQFQDRDYLLLDCPPASGLIVVNALYSADEVLIPVNGDYLSLQGVSYLIGTFRHFEEKLNHSIKQRFVMTRYHKRRRLPEQVLSKLNHYFPQKVLQTRIREVAALAECPGFGKTIFDYKGNSHGASDYRSLATELAACQS